MGNPAYLYENLIETASITSSTEDAAYPLENLYHPWLAKAFKFTVTTGGWIEFDFGSPQSFDTVCIHGHNLNSAATIAITAGAAPAPAGSIGAPSWAKYNIWDDVGAQTYRYLRVTIVDSNSVATRIGGIRIGTRVELSRPRRLGETPWSRDQKNLTGETYRGVISAYKRYAREKRRWLFQMLGQSQLDALRTLHELVDGNLVPFTMIEDTERAEALFGRKEETFDPQEEIEPSVYGGAEIYLYDYLMDFIEDSHGVDIEA